MAWARTRGAPRARSALTSAMGVRSPRAPRGRHDRRGGHRSGAQGAGLRGAARRPCLAVLRIAATKKRCNEGKRRRPKTNETQCTPQPQQQVPSQELGDHIEAILKEADKTGDNRIDLEEFCAMMVRLPAARARGPYIALAIPMIWCGAARRGAAAECTSPVGSVSFAPHVVRACGKGQAVFGRSLRQLNASSSS